MTSVSLQSLLDFALDATWQAGRITLGYFQSNVTVDRKTDNSPVTVADREAEKKVRELVARTFPRHGVLGEEFGHERGELTWIVDPIDGTKSFVCGVPLYGCLLALVDGDPEKGGIPLLGVAHFPALNETIYAARGEGCFWNGRRARVSKVANLQEAVLLMSEVSGYETTGKTEAWQKLVESSYIQRTWGDSYGYALVATGRAEVMLDARMEVWDCGPFQVIMEEAGGTFSDWGGNATIYGGEAIATNGALFDQVMALTRTTSDLKKDAR
jgi:histidinol-phosphatase